MIIAQMLVGAVGVALCLVLLYIVVPLIIRLGKHVQSNNSFDDDVDCFLAGVSLLIVIVLLASVFITSSYWLGEKILTVLGWTG